MKGFISFSAAAAATGLDNNSVYWIAGKDAPGDAGQGLFAYSLTSTAGAGDDTVVVGAGGRLLRVTPAQSSSAVLLADAIGADLRAGAAIPVGLGSGAASDELQGEGNALLTMLVEALRRTDSNGAAMPFNFDSLPQTMTYEDGSVKTISATDGTYTWTQTFTFAAGNLTGVSAWVRS